MLKALMEYIGENGPEPLNGFSLAQSDVETPGSRQHFYFCLGRHDFYLVPFPKQRSIVADHQQKSAASKQLQETNDSEKKVLVVSYRSVQEVIKHEDEQDSMAIVLFPGTLKRYKHRKSTTPQGSGSTPKEALSVIHVHCGDRQNLLTEFVVCLKASHMFFTFEIHTDDVVRTAKADKSLLSDLLSKPLSASRSEQGSSSASREQEVVEKFWRTNASRSKVEKHAIQGYSFFVPQEYRERSLTGMNKKLFYRPAKRNTESLELGQVKIREGVEDAILLVEQVDPTGEKLVSIQNLAERKMRDICGYVTDWRLRARPCVYQKRMNLTGDPSAWTCWTIKLRTLKSRPSPPNAGVDQDPRQYELRNVTIIACRRNFIHPTMQSHCDFVVTHVGQYEDFSSEVDADETCQLVCDTFSPNSRVYERDDLVIQATADALLLDDPSYFWYESELRVRPRSHGKAREFCRALFDLMMESNAWNDSQKAAYAQIVADCESQFMGRVSTPGTASTKANTGPNASGMTRKESAAAVRPGSGSVRLNARESAGGGAYVNTPASQLQASTTTNGNGEWTTEDTPTTRVFRIAEELELMAPGLDTENDSNRADWVAWRIRVWRYLAYCADGALFKEAVNFEQLCRTWRSPSTDKEARQVLARVLDKFIHLRQIGEEYKPDELHQKASSERLMSACTFNERVMAKLLKKENGYIQAALSAYDPYLYPKFLVRLLCRSDEIPSVTTNSTTGTTRGSNSAWLSDSFGGAISDSFDPCEPISHAVLKSLVVQSSSGQRASAMPGSSASAPSAATSLGGANESSSQQDIGSPSGSGNGAPNNNSNNASSEDKAYDVSLNILVPALIRVFMNHPDDDKLRTFVVAILVNFSRNNYSVKANILAGGFAREIVKLLRSKDDDLVRHACSLLTNLTKTTDFRSTIYRGSTKASLLELIQRNAIAASVASLPESDKYRAPKIISQACQVLGNLAIDASNRADLLKGEEIQHDADGNYAISILVRTLADLVFKEDYLATFKRSSSKDRQELDEVRASALFALKNLSISASSATTSSSNGTSSSSTTTATTVNNLGLISNKPKISVKSALGRYASKPFLRILRDKEVRDRNLIDYLLRLLYSLCYEPKVATKLHVERIADGLALRKQDFANLCLQIQTKIANQQKVSSQSLFGGSEEDQPQPQQQQQNDIFNTFQAPQPIAGGILRQSKYSGRQNSANPAATTTLSE